jgi:hypothetical protein
VKWGFDLKPHDVVLDFGTASERKSTVDSGTGPCPLRYTPANPDSRGRASDNLGQCEAWRVATMTSGKKNVLTAAVWCGT